MTLFSIDDLKTLLEVRRENCLSVFMPTHKAGTDTQQDPIRLRNLIREAEKELIEAGTSSGDRSRLLSPVSELIDDAMFWRYRSDGLAIFSSPTVFHVYKLPLKFQELLVVASRFHIKPFLPLLTCDGQFYILALSQNNVRLLQGTRYSINELEAATLPRSLAETLKYDDYERQIQHHTTVPTGDGKAAVYHGHGGAADVVKENILQYFRNIDRELNKLIGNKQFPLVLAGVDYLLPIYREANTYHSLIGEGVTGNPDRINEVDLQSRAWDIVEPYFLRDRDEAIVKYLSLLGTGRTINKLEDVLPAACQGLIDVLFVPTGVQVWGLYDAVSNHIDQHDEQMAGDEDLLDYASVQTLINKGDVYAVLPQEMPDEATVSAILRY